MNTTIKKARNILETCLKACDETTADYELYELKELMQKVILNLDSDDYWLELDSAEVRLIDDEAIDQIWTDSLIEQVKEGYNLDDHELPSFIAIDWEQTADNCKVDGKGHHFASYDGEEHKAENFFIFRTN